MPTWQIVPTTTKKIGEKTPYYFSLSFTVVKIIAMFSLFSTFILSQRRKSCKTYTEVFFSQILWYRILTDSSNVQDIFYLFRTRVCTSGKTENRELSLLKVVSSHFYFWLTPHYYRENETLYTKLPGENLNLKHHILTTTTKQKQRDFDLLVRHLVITSCDDFSKNVQFGEVLRYVLTTYPHLRVHTFKIALLFHFKRTVAS